MSQDESTKPTRVASQPTANSSETGHVLFLEKQLQELQASPENDKLYRPISPDDPEVLELAKSIRKFGLLESLVITRDGYIISGHRRFAACRLAGLKVVPVRQLPICRRDDPDAFLVTLREYNRQRDKSADEKLREEVVSVSPQEAHAELIEYRRKQAQVTVETINIREYRPRSAISDARIPFLHAAQKIVSERQKYWPLSDRQIHYALLNDPPLKHAGKPDSRYDNTPRSYKALTDLLTRARIVGEIPMEAIGDETRPVLIWRTFANPRQFIREELNSFLKDYYRDYLQSQPNHIEIIVEKNTIAPIVKPVAMEYCVPMTSGRGFCSLPPRADLHTRFIKSGKEKLILLFASDHDPEGVEIPHSFARSLRDDFGIDEERIVPIKVALNPEQIQKFKLPPQIKAKKSSPNYKKFVADFGTDAYELEALQPDILQELFRNALDKVLELDLYNLELSQEQNDSVFLSGVRQRTHTAIADLIQEDNE